MRKTHPILFGLALGPLARRQAVVVEVLVSIVLEPHCIQIGQHSPSVIADIGGAP
jgi:hypothetical protein